MNSYQLPNFDDMMKLAQDNPEAFEAMRQELIEDCINSAPTSMQQRLRGLQFQINADRDTSHNPLESMIKANKRMMASFNELRNLMETWELPTEQPQAKVLQFNR